jgi:hypothetical protein
MVQVYQCWWRVRWEINVFSGSNITCFTFYIHLWPIYWLSLVDKKIPTFFMNAEFYYRVHKCSSLVLTLSQMNPVHNLTPCFFKRDFNIILSSKHKKFLSDLFPWDFLREKYYVTHGAYFAHLIPLITPTTARISKRKLWYFCSHHENVPCPFTWGICVFRTISGDVPSVSVLFCSGSTRKFQFLPLLLRSRNTAYIQYIPDNGQRPT